LKTELYRHQRDAILLMKKFKRYGLWLDTGTGKTLTCLKFLEEVKPWPTLVLCPLSIVGPAWESDAKKFTSSLNLVACSGSAIARRELSSSSVKTMMMDGLVFVANYEAFRSSCQAFLTIPWSCIILDESTRVMNPKAKISKLVHRLTSMDSVEYCFALSGCPTPNSKLEFWSQVHAFDPTALESSYYSFRHSRFYQPNGKHQWLWVPRPGAEAGIVDQVANVSVFVRKEDCLSLPPQTHEVREVTLASRERTVYDQFLKDWVVRLDEGDIVGSTALSELMKLRQMTAGLAKNSDGDWMEIGDSKLKALKELVQDIGKDPHGRVKSIVIVGQFRREIERTVQVLGDKATGRKCAILYGGLSADRRDESIRGFQDGVYDTLVVHPASAGHGLTFVNCADMIFASLSYSYEQYYQVMQRIHRIGQKRACTYHYLICPGTIDEKIHAALQKKQGANMDMVEMFRRAPEGTCP